MGKKHNGTILEQKFKSVLFLRIAKRKIAVLSQNNIVDLRHDSKDVEFISCVFALRNYTRLERKSLNLSQTYMYLKHICVYIYIRDKFIL